VQIYTCETLSERDLSRYAWSGLRAYYNVATTVRKINELHNIKREQQKNAEKQAYQIRFCLQQAEEYFQAVKSVGLATSPVLAYYGCMSLALAEILLKQDGKSSLDQARGQHAHHGLDFRKNGNPSKEPILGKSAANLRAVPLVKADGGRFGTFELWHRSSRMLPTSGKKIVHLERAQTDSIEPLAQEADERLRLLPKNGISFLDCLKALPQFNLRLRRLGIQPSTVRATLESEIYIDKRFRTTLILQPGEAEIHSRICDQIFVEPRAIEHIELYQFDRGVILNLILPAGCPPVGFRFPKSHQVDDSHIFLHLEDHGLNEFGLLYVGLFIIGNYARYFPDEWMFEIEKSTDLAIIVRDFIDIVCERVPLLALSELDRCQYLIKDQ
jgi:hypothetical protein